jgi:hypothetical protein
MVIPDDETFDTEALVKSWNSETQGPQAHKCLIMGRLRDKPEALAVLWVVQEEASGGLLTVRFDILRTLLRQLEQEAL